MPARARLPLALFVLLLAGAAANAAFVPGDNLRSLESGGLTRTYRVHVPPGYDGSSPSRWWSTSTVWGRTPRSRKASPG